VMGSGPIPYSLYFVITRDTLDWRDSPCR
jgi:hypothetical protein